ncbi:FAD-dependent oxidoreductase [Emcibacter nanhaiensis]|uniref:FAD-dependent oxidoreductase n=1 Tax=Emcibacter nanhaiensis TaxID=1505037 RepID=A0A501PKJ2_9PROT|nr:FAD-dependent oxidoreductase [Emcibacter nanhaiensis]TPD60236.1 FAD-dependent oxidoreductase [Emcibacter nanhaiensis]
MTQQIYDVAIIGAGPAGLAAASELVAREAKIVLLDEQARPGGQITRQPPKGFTVKNWLRGNLYKDLKKMLRDMEDHPGINWRFSVTVSGVGKTDEDLFEVWYQDEQGLHSLTARRMLVATGCYERPLVFPGATVPGVMGTGAIQTLLKSQQLLAGNRFVFTGAHPLQMIVAEQVLATGGKVEAVLFAQPFSRFTELFKHLSVPLTHWNVLLAAGRAFLRLKRAGVPVLFGRAVTRVEGQGVIDRIEVAPVSAQGEIIEGPHDYFEADRLGLCYGFQVSSELARQVGAESYWSGHRGGWLIHHDGFGQSSLPGLFVAGEVTGMAGADAGMAEGHIAGLGLLRSLDLLDERSSVRLVVPFRKQLRRHLRFARYLSDFSRLPPKLATSLRTDDSLLCRCENIKCSDLKTILRGNPRLGRSGSIKLQSRIGMGLCQGRLCYANFADLVSDQTGKSPEDIGPFQAQWPAKPLLISDIIKK